MAKDKVKKEQKFDAGSIHGWSDASCPALKL